MTSGDLPRSPTISHDRPRSQVRLSVAILGYVTAHTLLVDRPEFKYYDAAVHAINPQGGPPGGGTTLTLSGRALLDSYLGVQVIAIDCH